MPTTTLTVPKPLPPDSCRACNFAVHRVGFGFWFPVSGRQFKLLPGCLIVVWQLKAALDAAHNFN